MQGSQIAPTPRLHELKKHKACCRRGSAALHKTVIQLQLGQMVAARHIILTGSVKIHKQAYLPQLVAARAPLHVQARSNSLLHAGKDHDRRETFAGVVTQALERRMSVAVHQALRSVFCVHRSAVPCAVLVGDTALLPMRMQLEAARLYWLARYKRARSERYISAANTFAISPPALTPQPPRGRPPTGASWLTCATKARKRLVAALGMAAGQETPSASGAVAPPRRSRRIDAQSCTCCK